MSDMILTRHPSGKLLPVVDDEGFIIEFDSEDAAEKWADKSAYCQSTDYSVVEVFV